MGLRRATRAQALIALRQWMPNQSIRRLGDMIDQAELITLQAPPPPKPQEPAPSPKLPPSLAFGLVLEGLLGVTINGEKRWVGPGQLFEVPSNPQGDKTPISLALATNTVRYWAFSRETVTSMGFVRRSGSNAAGDRE